MSGGRSFDDPSRRAPETRERKDVVASAAGEQRYGAPIGTEIGQARDERERAAQGDPRARKLMEDVDPSVGAKELTNRFAQLNDADLQGLTKLAYSFRGTSPEIVAVRTALANALSRRGQDVRQFGARGGGKGPDKPGKGKGSGGKGKGKAKASRLKGDDNGDGTIDEDESGWDPATMGNRRGYRRDGTYVDNNRRKPEVVRKVRGEKGLTMGDGMSLFGDVETKAQSARTRTDGKASNDPSSTSTFPPGDWKPAPKGMTCSRHQHGDNPPPAVAYRVVNGTKLGACKTHKAEMTESKGLVDPREDLIFETKSDGHVPPQSVRANGRKAQEAIKAGKAGANFTSAGRTRAAQLARGDALSLATVKRMHSYFERHSGGDQGKQHEEGTPAHTAWLAWGGSAGRNWARGIVNAQTESKALIRVAPGEPLGAGLDDAEAWDEGVMLGLLPVAQFKLSGGFKPGQTQPSKNPGATKLREYWVHGKGAVKIKWGVPGDFKRCVTQMRKYVGTRAEGLCNVYHRAALGVAPGQEGGGKGHGHKGVLLDAGDQVEFKTLYVESDGGEFEMRLVRMIEAPEVKGGLFLDEDEDEDAAEALDDLDNLDGDERRAMEPVVEALDDERKGLAAALARHEYKSHHNDPDAFYHSYGQPGVAPWQRHARLTGDVYTAGMMLGLAGLRADAPAVREAKAAGIGLVDVVDVIERKDVSTASGGTAQSWSFGSTEREGGDDAVAAANARAKGPRRLRHHFTRTPEGLQEWRPSQPGRFRRLTKALRRHVGAGAEGVAAIYYRQVMGHWPGTAGRGVAMAGVKSIGLHWDALGRPDLYRIEAKGTPPPPPRKGKGKRVPRPAPDTEELTPEEVAAAQAEDDDPVEPLPDDPSQTPEDGTERAEDERGAAPAKMGNRIPELDADDEEDPDADGDDDADPDAEEDADPGEPLPVAPDDGSPRGEGDEGEVAEDVDADPNADPAAAEVDPETGEPVAGDQPSLDAAVAGEDGTVSPALAALFPELDTGGGAEDGNDEGEFEDALLDDPDYLINPDGSLQMVDDDGNPVDEESADDELGRPDLDAGPGDQAAGDPSDPEDAEFEEGYEEGFTDGEEDDAGGEEDDEEDPEFDDVEQDDDEDDEDDEVPGDEVNDVNPAFGRPPTPKAGPKGGPTGPRPPAPAGNAPPSAAKPTRQGARGETPGPPGRDGNRSTGPVDSSKPGPVDKPGKAAKPGPKVNQPPFGQGRKPSRSGPSRATKAILS